MGKGSFLYKLAFIILVLISYGSSIVAQYISSGITLEGTYGSAVNWVDIDSDNDLDLTISGFNFLPSSARGKLYLNNGTTLLFNRDIRLMQDGDETWCDFNRDGNPDMLYAGKYPVNAYSAGIDIFNISGGFTWSSLSSGFIPVINASVDWGDYDNDGDYDALISGEDAAGLVMTRIYRNDYSVFSDIIAGIPGVTDGKVLFIDYDLDKDLDIFISGLDINKNKYSRLWKNNEGVFTITTDIFANLKYSQFDWADFNNDGYPDLLIGGFDNTAYVGYIYLNVSGNSFNLSSVSVPGCEQGSSGFGDVDNDGDLDVFISGKKQDSGLDQKFIFLNDGAGSLVPSDFLSTAVLNSFFQFGDWNKDQKLDFVVNGYTPTGGKTVIANNNSGLANTVPTAPLNPTAEVFGRNVLLKWSHSTDNPYPAKSLTYNIYVGTSSKGIDIVSPNANVDDGFRKISRPGYIQDTAWILKNLSVGTYYWGVQAIDNSLGASYFSEEGTFEISDRFSLVPYTEDPSVSSPALYFDADHDGDLDMFLNDNDAFYAVENTNVPFTESNYKLIQPLGFNPIKTISPNDYNNDNKIDFTVSGFYMGTGVLDSSIALYAYNTDFNYDIAKEDLVKNLDFEYTIWADFNNDGKQDLLTSGRTTNLETENKPATYIYKNLGEGSFEKVNKYIRGFEKCGAVEGDFDNDKDIDFIIYGKDSTGTANTYIYINEGDFNFTESLIPGNQLYRAYFSYGIFTGDFDQNNELDIYLAGEDPASDFFTRVLLNHDLNFSDANLAIRSSPGMSNFWADYDYDGDLDLFYTSVNATPSDKLRLYMNNAGSLDEVIIDLGVKQLLDLPFMAVNIDNKNGLDFILKRNSVDYLFHQYYDNWGSNERNSESPDNTGYDQDKLDIILKWDKLSGCPSCTYNIRVGSSPGDVDIMSPMSDLTTGYRYVVRPGNTYLNNSWTLSDLPVGTYYWSVQAVDPSNTGGPFSSESTFIMSHVDADFSFSVACKGETTYFTDLSVGTDPITKWKWNFGDGSSSSLKNPEHLYSTSGTFITELWAYSDAGDSASVNYNVEVKGVPSAAFSADIACQGTPTVFTNTTNDNGLIISSWDWDFGDGQYFDDEQPAPHGYLTATDYIVELKATASNGCADSTTNIVTVAAIPIAAITANPPLTFCKGDSITLSVPYYYSYIYTWKVGGVNLAEGDSSRFAAKLTGNYSVEVTNPVGNCTANSSEVSINVIDAPTAPLISANGDLEFCQGDSVILSVTNTAGYSYEWKLNGGAVGENSNQHTAKTPGNYSLIVSNISGCETSSSNSIDIIVNPVPTLPTVNVSGAPTFCQGSSVDLSVTNNTAYSYQWKNNNIAITGATTNSFNVQSSGLYSLKITNSSGCEISTEDVSINVLTTPTAPLIIANGDLEFCQGDSVILSVTNTTGYSYEWKLNGGAVGENSNQHTAKTPGNYSLIVSNISGCEASSSNSIDIIVNPVPTLPTVNVSGAPTFCQGSSVDLSVTNNTAYTYQWKNNNIAITGATTNTYNVQSSGLYSLKITNSSECAVSTEDVSINVLTTPTTPLIIANGDLEFCQGDSVILSVTNTAGYSYEWKLNGGAVGENSNQYTAKTPGNYSLIVSNTSGCETSSSNSIDIIVNPVPTLPTVNVSGAPTFCQGGSVDLSVDNNPAYTYQWENNGTTISGAVSYIYTAQTSGVYLLKISNSNGCITLTGNVPITVLDIPASPTISANAPVEFCQGDSVIFSVTNTTGYSYQWKLNGGAVGTNSNQYVAKNAGTYSLTVSNIGGCSVNSSNTPVVTVNAAPNLSPVSLSGSTDLCQGEALAMSVPLTSGYTYQWNNEFGPITGATLNTFSATTSGQYSLNISNSYNCVISSSPINVVVETLPTVPLIVTEDYEPGKCKTENPITLKVDQPVNGYSYSWKRNGTILSTETNTSLVGNLSAGDYNVEVNNNGCLNESSAQNIYFEDAPKKPELYVVGPVVWYMAASNDTASQYRWYLNNELIPTSTKFIHVANKTLGTYKVAIANELGCFTMSDEITIPTTKAGMTDFFIPEQFRVEETDPFAGLKIYPNPSPGMFTVEMNNNISGELDIKIFTNAGRQILNIKFDKTTEHFQSQIDLSGQGTGLYLINFSLDKYKADRKIVVE